MAQKFDWKSFVRIAGGIFLTLLGAAIFGRSQGQLLQLIIGGILAAIGVALLLLEFY